MKKVSIIIPAYNVQEYIEETLQSFISQTLEDIEIIVVDDGSTDATCRILDKYQQADKRIKVLHQANKGAGIARNLGMEHAVGEYLYFFDADDYCIPPFLEHVVEKADGSQADIVVFDYYRVDQITKKEILYHGLNRALLPKGKDSFNYQDVPNRILTIVNPTPWNKLYRRSYIQATKLQYLGLSTTNDITFAALSVAMAQKVVYYNEPFMYYRVNRESAITSFKQKKLGNVIAAVDSVIEQASSLPYAGAIKNAIAYFAISNFIYALENYAGKPQSKFYREYYKSIHGIFQREMFQEVTEGTLNYKKLYKKFKDVRKCSYSRHLCKKLWVRLVRRPRLFIRRHLPLSRKFFEQRTKKLFQRQTLESKRIRLLNKRVRELSNQVATLTQMIESSGQSAVLAQLMENPGWSGVCASTRSPRIIVSMTSFPARIGTVKEAIKSIMLQTVKADKIVLWLAKDNFPSGEEWLPEGLLQLRDKGLEIRWCDEDYRSYKKILPSLQAFPEDILITVDDDLIYPPTMIESLYDSYKKYPKCISTVRTHQITFGEDGSVRPYAEWIKGNSDYIGVPRMDLFATTGAGTLFPPHCLPKETADWEVIKELCPHADDIWIKMMSLMNHIPTVLVTEQKRLAYIQGTQAAGRLWDINITENDKQLRKLLKKYNGRPKGKGTLLEVLGEDTKPCIHHKGE
ncbi:MAG: glycosyltransferase family 2 protein [Lachnospiraceae bacterium]|jgi:glycosyltransferase involved in cell wall biosynthesis|nr:glycosyltransferase family 2 protein [Lachnospiraceae bacterium]